MIRMIIGIFIVVIIAYLFTKFVGYIAQRNKKQLLQDVLKVVLFWRSLPYLKWQFVEKIIKFLLRK